VRNIPPKVAGSSIYHFLCAELCYEKSMLKAYEAQGLHDFYDRVRYAEGRMRVAFLESTIVTGEPAELEIGFFSRGSIDKINT